MVRKRIQEQIRLVRDNDSLTVADSFIPMLIGRRQLSPYADSHFEICRQNELHIDKKNRSPLGPYAVMVDILTAANVIDE